MGAIGPMLRRYSVPLFLFVLGLVFQLVVLPSSFPPSHYSVLGVKEYASIEEVQNAYEKLSSKWSSGSDSTTVTEFIKVRYAFELLTDPLWKRDYDLFGVDEQMHVIEKANGQYDGVKFSEIDLPLLDASPSDLTNRAFNVLTPEKFISIIGKEKAVLIQVYSHGSPRCSKFISIWESIVNSLEGVADTGMVELGDVQLASYFAEKKSIKQPFFRNGLPLLVAFPPTCKSTHCYVRYQGDFSVDTVVDWMATNVLGLPRILYYTKETLVPNFLEKSGQHKVKIIYFSTTGERAAPFLRQAAKDYWAYSSFAVVLFRQEDSSIWRNVFHVESAPAIVFIKEMGVKPVVHYGNINSSQFLKLVENNKHHELPQLRSVTSKELGCDAKGFSRAGNDTMTWYCAIVTGRPSRELNKMRETMRRVQSILLSDVDSDHAGEDYVDSDNAGKDYLSVPASTAATAFKEHHLTFAWLDGEIQKDYCKYYINREDNDETCGPRSLPGDVPRLFMIRYHRNSTENEMIAKRRVKNFLDSFDQYDANVASQLLSVYNGQEDTNEIIQWISWVVAQGNISGLPYNIGKTPQLIPEDGNPTLSKSAQGMLVAGKGIKQTVQSIVADMYDYMKDPRVGPILLLAACTSFGFIWLQSSQATQPSPMVERRTTASHRNAGSSSQDKPSSITDEVPKDAYQLLPSDSESE